MFADQADEALSSQPATGVQLLAHEDSALKAYYETRGRYLRGIQPRLAFNQIGEALPAIVIDGTVAGTWSWDSRSQHVCTQVIAGRTTPADRHLIRQRAAALTNTLRAASDTRPGLRPGSQSGKSAHHRDGGSLRSLT
jgi:hypothetical protein